MSLSGSPANAKAKHLLLPLNRPQYVVPEAFATSLAWSLYEVDLAPAENSARGIALQYRAQARGAAPTLEYRRTDPLTSKARREAFADSLENAGVISLDDQPGLAAAVANSICGIQTKKGKSQPASPMTEGMALLQNMVGLQGARNPPALATIIEALFGLGRVSSESTDSAADLWQSAVRHRVEIDPLCRSLDTAVKSSLLDSMPKPRSEAIIDPAIGWHGMLPDTPFSWLNKSWSTLTSEVWVEALPARVWVDWASTVLRMGLGMGFLWEAAWYETTARQILARGELSWGGIRSKMPDPLPWRSVSATISVRDVASILGHRARRGDQIRQHLADWVSTHSAADEDLGLALEEMSLDAEFTGQLERDLGTVPRSGTNLWEAIRYALLVREESGPFADHYGFLRSRGRHLFPDPGTEWIAVIASLRCSSPSSQTDLGKVMGSLNELGLEPELTDVVRLLERAGLARGSADADQGVVVQSAFSEG